MGRLEKVCVCTAPPAAARAVQACVALCSHVLPCVAVVSLYGRIPVAPSPSHVYFSLVGPALPLHFVVRIVQGSSEDAPMRLTSKTAKRLNLVNACPVVMPFI